MAYCTVDDVRALLPEQVLGELTRDLAPFDFVDESVVTSAIYQADREIDAHLVVRMPIPLSTVPLLIAQLSAKIAVHRLHVRKHIDSAVWGQEYDRCIDTLRRIQSGELGLGPDAADDAAASEPGARISAGGATRKFTATVWSTYR